MTTFAPDRCLLPLYDSRTDPWNPPQPRWGAGVWAVRAREAEKGRG